MNRKDFLPLSTEAALSLGLSTTVPCKEETLEKTNTLLNKSAKETAFGLKAPKIDKIRIGILYAGNRVQTLIQMFDWLIKNNNAEIVAFSDLRKEKKDKLNAHLKKKVRFNEYREKYNHPLWSKLKTKKSDNSVVHGGMGFAIIYHLIKYLNKETPLHINIYGSVLWSAITPISELSVAQIKVPDFIGGTWKNKNTTEMLRNI